MEGKTLVRVEYWVGVASWYCWICGPGCGYLWHDGGVYEKAHDTPGKMYDQGWWSTRYKVFKSLVEHYGDKFEVLGSKPLDDLVCLVEEASKE